MRAAAPVTLIALLLAWGCGSSDDAAGSKGSVEWTGERGPLRMTVRVTPEAVSAGDRLTLVLEVGHSGRQHKVNLRGRQRIATQAHHA